MPSTEITMIATGGLSRPLAAIARNLTSIGSLSNDDKTYINSGMMQISVDIVPLYAMAFASH